MILHGWLCVHASENQILILYYNNKIDKMWFVWKVKLYISSSPCVILWNISKKYWRRNAIYAAV